jgi:hypothetical protein
MKSVIEAIRNFFRYILIDFWADREAVKGQRDNQAIITGDVVVKTAEERKQSLEAFIVGRVSQGWRVEVQTEYLAVLAFGKKPNHILHFLLCFPTFGFWLIVWIILGMSMTVKRRTFQVNDFGQIKQIA